MSGKPEVLVARDTTGGSTPGLGWEEVKAELVQFFASIKLAMFLFIVLAITATIGTVIQQGERPEVYIKEYGEETYRWFVRLGFIDVYHTWWFTSLLALLCINSLTCFHQRFPAIWRSMQQDKVNIGLPFIKGMMGRVGAHVDHLSATVIVLGGLIGSYWGFQEFGVCLEGQTYHIPKGNFDLHVNKFWIDYNDNGSVKSYNSTLTVLEQGQPVTMKTITVNDPLVHKGIWFYQSSYGDAWDRVEVARIHIKDKATEKILKTVDLEWKKEKTVDGLGLKLVMTDFVADFGFNSSEKVVYSKTVEHENPAIRLAITEQKTPRAQAVQATPWIFYHYPDLFEIQGSRYRFELVGYQPKKFTGLQITKDPGVNIVWVGSTMIVVGITLSSFIYHRRLWAKVIPGAGGVTVHIGGNTHKSQIDFQKEFRKLTERIQTMKT